jgi:hypothetical protein
VATPRHTRDAATDESTRATALVDQLNQPPPETHPFEIFDALDKLPEGLVRAALVEKLGPARAPEELEDAVRLAHGFDAPPLALLCTQVVKPRRATRMTPTMVRQLERATSTWDGLELPLAKRLADDAFQALEHRTIEDEDFTPQFDVVLFQEDSGAIFRAGAAAVIGTVAYGKVEMTDRREREGLQRALDAGVPDDEEGEDASEDEPTTEPNPPVEVEVEVESAKTVEELDEPAPARKKTAAKKKAGTAAPKKKAAATAAPKKKAAATAKPAKTDKPVKADKPAKATAKKKTAAKP